MGANPSKDAISLLSKDARVILEEVKEHPVVMYTIDNCPYCVKAKDELAQDGITVVEKNLNARKKTDPAGVEAYVKGLTDLTRQKTVPQIFICGKFIGGYTEMHAKRANLHELIQECSVESNSPNSSVRPKL